MNLDKDQLSGRIQVVVTKRAMIIIDVATLRPVLTTSDLPKPSLQYIYIT
jgi:hypothetical protein